jgi:hypothetical protein
MVGFVTLSVAQSPHGPAFTINCAACHSPEGWDIHADLLQTDLNTPGKSRTTGLVIPVDSSRFNHNKDTRFPLEGRHARTDCRDCHGSLVFSEAGSACMDCHTDIHQQTVGSDCARCHTLDNWLVDNIQELHFENGFPLTGVHAAVTCNDCHRSETALRFGRIGNDCASCHLTDFNQADNPNHKDAGFSINCLDCHDVNTPGWQTDQVNHDFFPLTKGHEIADCAQCHTGGSFAGTPNTCFACHQPDFESTVNPGHLAAGFSTDCASCHTTDPDWVPAQFLDHDALHFPVYSGKHEGTWSSCTDCHSNPNDYAVFSCTVCHLNPETDEGHAAVTGYVYENSACLACHPTGDAAGSFNHDDTGFPLTGAHVDATCVQCHANGYAGTPTDCASCHSLDFEQTVNPDHGGLGLSTDCASCHSTVPGWAPASFDIHDNYYVLNGAHAAIANDCAACHNGDYNNTPNTCAGCHSADYNAATEPDHAAHQLPTDCQSCHTENAWAPSTFDHAAFFPFTGAHLPVANNCSACHLGGDYANTPNTCAGCHQADYNQSMNPGHVALNLPDDCAMCHSTEPGWMPAGFPAHDDYYALNGAHAAIANDCAACHNGDYNNTPNTCYACHSSEYDNSSNPNHLAAQFPTDCASCHGESNWVPATFDHDGQYFPIYSGAHDGEWSQCLDCHTDPGNYASFSCTGCHANPQTDDEHAGVTGYVYQSNACLACHPTGEGDNIFDHNSTSFALTGAHLGASCLDCHSAGFAGTPTDCASCHSLDFNSAANPNHQALGLSMDCAACHTTQPGWAPASFSVHDNYYALNGAHAAIANDCAACHNGDYLNTPNTCVGCHAADYNAATSPDHVANQFPSDCQSCHGEAAWSPSTFDHSAFYPFTGAHTAIANDCAACHIGGNYSSTPNTCAGCHQADYNQSANPSHTALNLSNDCAMCHSTAAGWEPAGFPVHDDYYALNGAHASIANDCAACHNGNYTSTPNTCFGCHSSEYENTMDPDHQAAQFSTDCAACHGESAWVPATFDHDGQYFPIYSGSHEGEWSQCLDCHTDPGNFTVFTCTTCHANPETNDQHAGVSGYAYQSSACLACHPSGEGDDIFDHSTTGFALTGAHQSATCLDCHVNGYSGTPSDCASCHTVDFNAAANPNHVALGLSLDCAGCHTTEPGWAPASFSVHNNYYALNGAHAGIANDCAACHNGNYNNTPNTCSGCHLTNYNQATSPNHAANQFPTNCENCHTETAWAPSTFDHSAFYPFTGGHIPIANDCAACHVGGNYSNTPNTCEGCHLPDFNSSANPNHVALAIPTDCDMCHTTSLDWEPAAFPIHNNYWQLNGAHAAIANDCATCHNGNYNNTPNTCSGCHLPNYNQTTNPNHAASQFPTTCENCHTETAWAPATFDHSAFYPFTGAHIPIANDCAACHIGGSYSNTPNTCEGCHLPAYNSSVNPNHVALAIPTDCDMCHTTSPDWEPATFPIHNNFWQLNGAHAAIANDCAACHNGNYNSTPNTCSGCHLTNYNQATNPNHAVNQFPTNCEDCHTQTAWVPSTFDHSAFYPFTGAHIPISNDCAACHVGGNYSNTPTSCEGCHLPAYNASVNPNHVALAIPTDCDMCHTTSPEWMPATFPIHNNYWPLNGAHAAIANDCAACHNGNYTNTPTTCYGCHASNYNSSNNPNHASAGFPTDCTLCHNETAWEPSTFDHDNMYFPIYSGKHKDVWSTCTECHTVPNNFSSFSCINCHEHDDPVQVGQDHQGVQGYQYSSPACYSCHPTGD